MSRAAAVSDREWRNWAGTARCRPLAVHRPATPEEVAAIVRRAAAAGARVKAAGSGHSCSDIACTPGHLVLLDRLAAVRAVDRDARTITVEGGMPLRRLLEVLHEHGLTLPTLGSIAEQTIAGAISTGTHGSGRRHGGLASLVTALELVTGTGEVVRLSETSDGALLDAARVGLGALGVITAVTLRADAAFDLHARERGRPLEDVLADLEQMTTAHEYARFWWFPHTDAAQEWTADRVAGVPRRGPSAAAAWVRQVLIGNHAVEATLAVAQAARAVPAHTRFWRRALFAGAGETVDRSDRVFTFPIHVRQHVMEHAIPAERCADALRGLRALIDERRIQAHFPVEVRFTAADDAWLSPAYGRTTCYIGVIAYRPFGRDTPYEDYFRAVDDLMGASGGRPHWAKVHYRDAASLSKLYPRFGDFRRVRDRLDPRRVFANGYLERVLGE